MMVRGSVFNIDFTGESEGDISITTEVQKGRGNSSSYNQKRAGINLTEEMSFKKLKNLKCLVYNIRGHTLPDCWYLFKCKRPEGFKAVYIQMKRVLIKIKHDKDLTA
jgi:hypothetical protein